MASPHEVAADLAEWAKREHAKGGVRSVCEPCAHKDTCPGFSEHRLISCAAFKSEKETNAMVARPPHYVAGPYECKAVEKALSDKMEKEGIYLTPYEARLYLAAFEYLWRAPFKGDMKQNVEKAIQDLQELVKLWP